MKNRQLHLWIGLLTSVIVLVESVTGLLLAEPWMMGASARTRPTMEQGMQPPDNSTGNTQVAGASGEPGQRFGRGAGSGGNFPGGGEQNSLMGFVKNLHAGRIGNTNVQFLASISAVAMIILTITGIVLSVRILSGKSKANQKADVQI